MLLRHGIDPAIISLQGFTAAQMATESIQQLLQVSLAWLHLGAVFVPFLKP